MTRYQTNYEFYRATRSVAFQLDLSWAQIELLIRIERDVTEHNERITLDASRNPGLIENNPQWYFLLPTEVDEGDGTNPDKGWFRSSTIRCLIDKGLITGYRHFAVLTRAGRLTFQLLQVSGHIQECEWSKAKLQEVVSP